MRFLATGQATLGAILDPVLALGRGVAWVQDQAGLDVHVLAGRTDHADGAVNLELILKAVIRLIDPDAASDDHAQPQVTD